MGYRRRLRLADSLMRLTQLAVEGGPKSVRVRGSSFSGHFSGIRSDGSMTKRLVYICDWLPPDFGAVGQYAVFSARDWAKEGWAVTLVGLTSGRSSRQPVEPVGGGSVEVIKVHRRAYPKQKFARR